MKGKVERFVGYLKGSFWVPFVAWLRQLGLSPDEDAANAALGSPDEQIAHGYLRQALFPEPW
jgi:transposase